MDLWPEMMFCVVAVVEPGQVIELAVRAHAPRNRLVRIAAVMPIVAIQIRQAVAKVPEWQKETDVMPVKNTEDNKCADKQCEFGYAPKRLARTLPFQLFKDGLGIFTEKTEERVFEWGLGFTVVSVLVNRNPIDGVTMLVGAIGVTLMMLHVNALVKNLAEAHCDRLQDTEQTIEERRTEIWIVNEIVGDAVDVPGNAHRIDKTENEHDPERHARKKIEHAEEVRAVQECGRNRDRVPACVRKDAGVRLGAFDTYEFAR